MSSIGYIKNYEDLPASDSDHTEQQSTLQILQDRDTIDQKGYPAAVDKVDIGIRHKRQAERTISFAIASFQDGKIP